jgi:hypothetical protein
MLSDQEKEVIYHNNFGICTQRKVKGKAEGLARIHAELKNPVDAYKQVESVHLEMAVYDSLDYTNPSYAHFFDDLVSKVSTGNKVMNFADFSTPNVFNLNFGSKLDWQLTGGTNYWKDKIDKYASVHNKKPLNDGSEIEVLQI